MNDSKNFDLPKVKCVEKILKTKFQNSNTKIQNDAVKLTTEVLRTFIAEAAARSAIQAQSESTADGYVPEVTNQHLEKILPQLVLHTLNGYIHSRDIQTFKKE